MKREARMIKKDLKGNIIRSAWIYKQKNELLKGKKKNLDLFISVFIALNVVFITFSTSPNYTKFYR